MLNSFFNCLFFFLFLSKNLTIVSCEEAEDYPSLARYGDGFSTTHPRFVFDKSECSSAPTSKKGYLPSGAVEYEDSGKSITSFDKSFAECFGSCSGNCKAVTLSTNPKNLTCILIKDISKPKLNPDVRSYLYIICDGVTSQERKSTNPHLGIPMYNNLDDCIKSIPCTTLWFVEDHTDVTVTPYEIIENMRSVDCRGRCYLDNSCTGAMVEELYPLEKKCHLFNQDLTGKKKYGYDKYLFTKICCERDAYQKAEYKNADLLRITYPPNYVSTNRLHNIDRLTTNCKVKFWAMEERKFLKTTEPLIRRPLVSTKECLNDCLSSEFCIAAVVDRVTRRCLLYSYVNQDVFSMSKYTTYRLNCYYTVKDFEYYNKELADLLNNQSYLVPPMENDDESDDEEFDWCVIYSLIIGAAALLFVVITCVFPMIFGGKKKENPDKDEDDDFYKNQ